MVQTIYFSGRVHSVNFADDSKAYYILRMILDAECQTTSPSITIRGDIPGVRIAVGVWFGFEGVWVDDPKYGPQVKVKRAPVLKNGWDDDTCEKILGSQGVGVSLAAKIRAQFPGDMLAALLDPEKLRTVPGITTMVAEHIVGKWKVARAQFQTLDFIGDLGLPQGRLRQVWALFGDRAVDVLSTDPWSLLEIDGVTFDDCDTIARRLSLDHSSTNPNRVKGAIVHAAQSGRTQGHMYLSSGDILATVRSLDPLITDQDVAVGLKALMGDKRLVVDRSQPGLTAIYEPWAYETESKSAEILLSRLSTAAIPTDRASRYVKGLLGEAIPDLSLREAGTRYLGTIGSSLGITLSPKQTEAVLNILTESVTILTGVPGSGKTTSLRLALTLLHEAGIQPLVVAPTGIAAKRVASVTGVPAFTIHRAFGAKGSADAEDGRDATYTGVVGESGGGITSDGEDSVWEFGPGNPHPAEVVLVDECSMVDAAILYRILTCTRPDTRLVFVGDAAQLPSVGAGNVLRDMIDSKRFHTVALTEIFRQADTSPIITAAHDTFHGIVPSAPMKSDFCLIPVENDDDVLRVILGLADKLFKQRANFQVLSPRHGGTLGVTNLNLRLRELLNPATSGLHEVSIGRDVLREGDRVIVCKNDYKLGISNGDVAKVNCIDLVTKEIEIKVHGPPVMLVRIPLAKARTLLRLAYAVTVHKMQGSEIDIVVMPLVDGFGHQLQRNLFYTAITRAKKKVLLVGSYRAMERAVNNNREDARNTLFTQRLQRNPVV